jgi:hypothetical protein
MIINKQERAATEIFKLTLMGFLMAKGARNRQGQFIYDGRHASKLDNYLNQFQKQCILKMKRLFEIDIWTD